jgi:5-(carboxyamino)imidazole ribonucleotide synthase
MMASPAHNLGVDLVVLASSERDSAAQILPHTIGDYRDIDVLRTFASQCELITFEHELVPPSLIRTLEQEGHRVFPTSHAFLYSQDKYAMRKMVQELGLPNPAFQYFADLKEKIHIAFPLIAKLPTGGYDGRGVFLLTSEEELVELFGEVKRPLLLEEKVDFISEAAIMVARSPHGQVSTWAVTETVQREGICIETISPAPGISEELSQRITFAAMTIAGHISLVGVMAMEIFITGDDFVINELAMRPHNSGHWTIEGSYTSQFEQHLRAVLDLPLGETRMRADYAVMGNIIGGHKEDLFRPYLHLMARTPELKFHIYRKEFRTNRKLGHVTLAGDDLLELRQEIAHARDYMSGEIDE